MLKVDEHLTMLEDIKEELPALVNEDGMLFMGAGGPVEDWRKGINNMLEEAGIIEKGKGWEHVYKFVRPNGIEYVLFSFKDIKKIVMEKLAIWRIQNRNLDVMWLSDWYDTYAKVEE